MSISHITLHVIKNLPGYSALFGACLASTQTFAIPELSWTLLKSSNDLSGVLFAASTDLAFGILWTVPVVAFNAIVVGVGAVTGLVGGFITRKYLKTTAYYEDLKYS